VAGWICAISLPKRWHGCKNAGFGLKFTNYFVFDRYRVKPINYSKKKGGRKPPLKDSAWACLLGKNGVILKTLETRFLAIT
jgi:hypothetical protein